MAGAISVQGPSRRTSPAAARSTAAHKVTHQRHIMPAHQGLMETSESLVRKRTLTELMPPPPPAKRTKRPKRVLDEDTYTEALSQIIARDFYPGLLETETQQEYLDALESDDRDWISSAGRRLKQVMTPGRHRSTSLGPSGATPLSVTASRVGSQPAVDTNMSLDAFHAKYTSEDNESFYKLRDRQSQKKMEKYAWLWAGNRLPSKEQLKQHEIKEKLCRTRSLADDGFKKDRLAIQDNDYRPAAPDQWKHKPDNMLMFLPDGVEDSGVQTVAQRAQEESRAAPKSIVHANTRIPTPNTASSHAPGLSRAFSQSLSDIRAAAARQQRSCDQESTTTGGETPRVNGYAFVEEDDSEPETSTSRAPVISLGKADATPNPFKIQERKKRDELHHRMVDRIAASKRSSVKVGFTGTVDRTPVPKFPSSPRVPGGLTPAAQRLWGKVGGGGPSASDSPFDGFKSNPRARLSGLRNAAK